MGSRKEITMSMTPYAAAKIVNAALKEYQVIDTKTDEIKIIPPQMMYTYAKKSYIATDDNGKITEEGLQEWIIKYLTKQGVKFQTETTDENPDQMSIDDIEDPNTTELADAAAL
jgi:hypothetical protein